MDNKLKNGLYVRGNALRWYKDGKLHRDDGPAVIRACGIVEYWIYGHQVTEGYLSRRRRGED